MAHCVFFPLITLPLVAYDAINTFLSRWVVCRNTPVKDTRLWKHLSQVFFLFV